MKYYMGLFYRRPIENLLARIVESRQSSQPSHLRNLSIVRDNGVQGTNAFYVQYSLPNFAMLVEDGHASWEAVERAPKGKSTGNTPHSHSIRELDSYGFPKNKLPPNLLKNGNATLRECLEVRRPCDYRLTISDPRMVKYDNGEYGLCGLPACNMF